MKIPENWKIKSNTDQTKSAKDLNSMKSSNSIGKFKFNNRMKQYNTGSNFWLSKEKTPSGIRMSNSTLRNATEQQHSGTYVLEKSSNGSETRNPAIFHK